MSLPLEQATISAAREQVSCELGSEAVILQTGDGIYYGLNDVGNEIWKVLQTSPQKFGQLVEVVMDKFEVSREQCDEDVRKLLGEMLEAKLVTISQTPE